MNLYELPTPALLIDADLLDANVQTMAAARPGSALRPHVKTHKCTALACVQYAAGHRSFTCATPREVVGMAAAGLGDDLLLANEVLDAVRLDEMATAQDLAQITIAVDSAETIDAAADAGLRNVLVDVGVGLRRCGCAPEAAGRIADLARGRGLEVRGVMGYEGHLMALVDRNDQRAKVNEAMDRLVLAHGLVGGDIVSAGGTGTYDLHDRVTEVQAGSYALMDTYYARLGLPFALACSVLGTVISRTDEFAVADVGLKAMAMDHGKPSVETLDGGATEVQFLSDEHITFVPQGQPVAIGDRVRVIPAHIDPTMSMHEAAWVMRGGSVIDRWPIDLRGW